MRGTAAMVLVFIALAGAAIAQPAPGGLDALSAKLARDAELADQNARSEALNVEVNRRNAAVDARNAAVRAAQVKAEADFRAAQAAHDAQVAKIRADDEAAQAAYAKAKAAWEARVAACKAGKVEACAPPPG